MTCTVLAEENERVVEKLLHGCEFELSRRKKFSVPRRADLRRLFLRLPPHRHRCDGFFVAVLRRKASR